MDEEVMLARAGLFDTMLKALDTRKDQPDFRNVVLSTSLAAGMWHLKPAYEDTPFVLAQIKLWDDLGLDNREAQNMFVHVAVLWTSANP